VLCHHPQLAITRVTELKAVFVTPWPRNSCKGMFAQNVADGHTSEQCLGLPYVAGKRAVLSL